MYILLAFFALLMTANTALTKFFQKNTTQSIFYMVVYNLINATFACGFFWVSAGFKIDINFATLIYAVVYALIICINLSSQVFAFSHAPVSVVTLMTMAGGVLLPSVFGIIYFDEPLTIKLVCSSMLIIIAAILPFVGKGEKGKFTSFISVVLCAFLFVLSGLSVILLKLYALDTRVCDSKSMFLLTNVSIVFICIVALVLFGVKNKSKKILFDIVNAFSPLQTLNIVSKAALANFASILQVMILTEMSASTFSVLNSALTLLGAGVVSAVIFREKQSIFSIVALLLAGVAIIINPV